MDRHGSFALFNVGPRSSEGIDELRFLLAGEPENEATWMNQDIVQLLSDRFVSSCFSIYGCAGSFTEGLNLMAEAVLQVECNAGSIFDHSTYFQSQGTNRIVRVRPIHGEFAKTVLLQGFATDLEFTTFAKLLTLTITQDMPMASILSRTRRSLQIAGDYAAFQLEISGGCTVRAAHSHPIEQQEDAQSMFSKYVHVSTMGDFVFYGVTTPTDYTRVSGHFHGASLNQVLGGHLTKVLAGSTIKIWAYEPSPDQVLYIRY
jgi:hypothetical protein